MLKLHIINVKEKWLQKWVTEEKGREVSLSLGKGYSFLNLMGKVHKI